MLLIQCPYCGEERPELEFRNAGEAHIARPSNITETSDEDFEAFLYLRANPKGIIYERWRHVHGCGRFFNAVRDTVTDRFFTTYKAGLPKPNPDRFAKAAAAVEPLTADANIPVVEAKKAQPAVAARPTRKPGATGASEPAPVDAPPDERKPARGGKRVSPPSNSDAPAAQPKPRRARTTTAADESASGTSEQSRPTRGRKATTPAGTNTGDTAAEAPKSASKRTRKTQSNEGEA